MVLQEFLSHWKTHLSRNSEASFTLFVAITDTDTKEHAALLESGSIFALSSASSICNSAGLITGSLHYTVVGLTFGRTKYKTQLQVLKSSKS